MRLLRTIMALVALGAVGLQVSPTYGDLFSFGGLQVELDNFGEFNVVSVNGTSIDNSNFVQAYYFNGSSLPVGNTISIVGNTATYTNAIGGFDLTITSIILGSLPSLGVSSQVLEQTIQFTNTTGNALPLAIVSGIDQDLDGSGGSANGDVVNFDANANAVFAADNPIFMAAIASGSGVFGWALNNSSAEPTAFPMANNSGPIVSSDTSMGLGYDLGSIAPGQSGSVTFRYLFDINGTSSVPNDFRFNSAQSVPEPGALAIWGLVGLMGAGYLRRRHKRLVRG